MIQAPAAFRIVKTAVPVCGGGAADLRRGPERLGCRDRCGLAIGGDDDAVDVQLDVVAQFGELIERGLQVGDVGRGIDRRDRLRIERLVARLVPLQDAHHLGDVIRRAGGLRCGCARRRLGSGRHRQLDHAATNDQAALVPVTEKRSFLAAHPHPPPSNWRKGRAAEVPPLHHRGYGESGWAQRSAKRGECLGRWWRSRRADSGR